MPLPNIRNAVLIERDFLDLFQLADISARYSETEAAIRHFLDKKGYGLNQDGTPFACCAWCGKPLKRSHKRFCCQKCQIANAQDPDVRAAIGALKYCKYCNAPLASGKRDYCDAVHRKAHDNQQWLALLKRVRRMRWNLTPEEIARELRASPRTIKGALAAIAMEDKLTGIKARRAA